MYTLTPQIGDVAHVIYATSAVTNVAFEEACDLANAIKNYRTLPSDDTYDAVLQAYKTFNLHKQSYFEYVELRTLSQCNKTCASGIKEEGIYNRTAIIAKASTLIINAIRDYDQLLTPDDIQKIFDCVVQETKSLSNQISKNWLDLYVAGFRKLIPYQPKQREPELKFPESKSTYCTVIDEIIDLSYKNTRITQDNIDVAVTNAFELTHKEIRAMQAVQFQINTKQQSGQTTGIALHMINVVSRHVAIP